MYDIEFEQERIKEQKHLAQYLLYKVQLLIELAENVNYPDEEMEKMKLDIEGKIDALKHITSNIFAETQILEFHLHVEAMKSKNTKPH